MSGKLAPSKSTVYVSNIPFSLTNNDLSQVFSKFGKVVKVTIVRDKITRESKGVAFVLFLERESVHKAVTEIDGSEMFGRKWKCSVARDNGRAPEFIKRKQYPDKSNCYECGEAGHLSYKCPKNVFGEREMPSKSQKRKWRAVDEEREHKERKEKMVEMMRADESDEEVEDARLESLSEVIKQEQQLLASRDTPASRGRREPTVEVKRKKRFKKNSYFSDEDDDVDSDDGGGGDVR